MENPKKKRIWLEINEADEKEVRKLLLNYIYPRDPRKRDMYQALVKNPGKPLKTIKWQLYKEHGINTRVTALKRMAENCGLPYTE